MTRKEFKTELINQLQSKGIEVDSKRIESAMNKTAIHSRHKYGYISWMDEHEECGVGNAICFYNEYKVADSFNRTLYNQNR